MQPTKLSGRYEFKVHHRQYASQVPPTVPPPTAESGDRVRRRARLVIRRSRRGRRQLQPDAEQLVVEQRGRLAAVHVVSGLAGRRSHVPGVRRPPSPSAAVRRRGRCRRRRFHDVLVARFRRTGRRRPRRRGQDVVVVLVLVPIRRRWRRRRRQRRRRVRGRHDGEQLLAPSPQPERRGRHRRRVVNGRGRAVLSSGGRRVRRGRRPAQHRVCRRTARCARTATDARHTPVSVDVHYR